ncbi:MAG: TPM domain-containing protein [Bacteroidales bacterium]|jgi:uncharacterized membrane protein|nr:TPM domain-containing protein [Bacteroidales bacterium]
MLSKKDQNLVVAAIREAERTTSGEIHVHISRYCRQHALDGAVEMFFQLGLDKTAARNGALIFVSLRDKKVAIIGDTGINAIVPDDFWNETLDLMRNYFRNRKLTEGLCKGIEQVGLLLKQYFPCQANDINELPDELTFS